MAGSIDAADLYRFLNGVRTNKEYTCTFCGNHQFIYNAIVPPAAIPIHVPAKSLIPSDGASPPHSFYSITCSNCGRTDFFHENQLNAWLVNHPPRSP